MHCIGVGGGMDGHRFNAHLAAGADDTQSNLATIGDQDFVENGQSGALRQNADLTR
jgi:hypothetical protein